MGLSREESTESIGDVWLEEVLDPDKPRRVGDEGPPVRLEARRGEMVRLDPRLKPLTVDSLVGGSSAMGSLQRRIRHKTPRVQLRFRVKWIILAAFR